MRNPGFRLACATRDPGLRAVGAPSGLRLLLQCSFPPFGRSCGILRVEGRDAGGMSISEGLARQTVCAILMLAGAAHALTR
jgi:hypothetical protein